MPDADSTNTVLDDVEPRPPARWRRCPRRPALCRCRAACRSRRRDRPPLAQARHGAHRVEEIGQDDGEQQDRRADGGRGDDVRRGAVFAERAEQIDIAHEGQVRQAADRVGQLPGGVQRPVAGLGHRLDDDGQHGGDHDADQQATGHLAHCESTPMISRPMANTNTGQVLIDPESPHRDGRVGGIRGRV